MADNFASKVRGLSALAEPARRALYLYVAAQPEPVSRDQAAAGTGLPRHTAKFHLDRLVAEGLLETEFRRLSARRGPGAGRPSKLYRRSAAQIAVTLPERHYDLAGQIMAEAIDLSTRDGTPVPDAVRRAATKAGHRLAASSAEPPALPANTAPSELSQVAGLLARQGYEPRIEEGTIVLTNCPFHALARDHTELVCGLNQNLITALLDHSGDHRLQARLDPAPDRCCVTLTAPAC